MAMRMQRSSGNVFTDLGFSKEEAAHPADPGRLDESAKAADRDARPHSEGSGADARRDTAPRQRLGAR